MQVNSTSQSVAALAASSTTAQTKLSQQEQAVAAPQTLQDDTVSISAAAQDMQVQTLSGSGDGVWPKKPK